MPVRAGRMASAHAAPRETSIEVGMQRPVQRLVGVQENVVRSRRGETLHERGLVFGLRCVVLRAEIVVTKSEACAGLDVAEGRCRAEWKVTLRGVDQTEDDQVVATRAQQVHMSA